ncbi:LytTR family transcriptional regulator DNA-binding domain-containing protein [Cohnella sp. GCM10027633]|uniref:LytTR family transcriptional regulator DNA-binding domain-containing protein n=1 Tax=unclassified Cohnella TaxID=2636738 RepID=UPI0036397C0E
MNASPGARMEDIVTAVLGIRNSGDREKICSFLEKLNFVIHVSTGSLTRYHTACETYGPDVVIVDAYFDRFNERVAKVRYDRECAYESFIYDILDAKHRMNVLKVESLCRIGIMDTPLLIAIKQENRKAVLVNEYCIVCIEKTGPRLSRIRMYDGKVIETRMPLLELKQKSGGLMLYATQSHLINRRYVDRIVPDPFVAGNFMIHLRQCDQAIPLSRKYYKSFVEHSYAKLPN